MIKKSIFKDGANKNLTHPNYKKGISLIVLVITIIVMIIIAATVIISIQDSEIIEKATKARDESNKQNLKEKIEMYRLERMMAESSGKKIVEVEEFLYSLVQEKLITDEEKEKLLSGESIRNEDDEGIKLGSELLKDLGVESITIEGDKQTLHVNQELQLIANVVLKDNASQPNVIWSSSNDSIAIVDTTGKVKTKSLGEVTITATAGGKSATYTLEVSNIINFTISGTPYQAEYGMTWEDFLSDPRYTMSNHFVNANGVGSSLLVNINGSMNYITTTKGSGSGSVKLTDTVLETDYYWYSSGTGVC